MLLSRVNIHEEPGHTLAMGIVYGGIGSIRPVWAGFGLPRLSWTWIGGVREGTGAGQGKRPRAPDYPIHHRAVPEEDSDRCVIIAACFLSSHSNPPHSPFITLY